MLGTRCGRVDPCGLPVGGIHCAAAGTRSPLACPMGPGDAASRCLRGVHAAAPFWNSRKALMTCLQSNARSDLCVCKERNRFRIQVA